MVFKNKKTQVLFFDLQKELNDDDQERFGDAIRAIAKEKITRIDEVDDFYVDEKDVLKIYQKVIEQDETL